jgi:transposase IS116/IS110/IS902 family protein
MDKISRSQDSRIVAAGIDAAKSTFSVCGLDGARRIALERSTGGKVRLGHITKAGDAYLRMLYVQAAKAALGAAHRRQDRLSRWALAVRARRGFGKAVVALAAKLARIAWALLSKGGRFRPEGLAAA